MKKTLGKLAALLLCLLLLLPTFAFAEEVAEEPVEPAPPVEEPVEEAVVGESISIDANSCLVMGDESMGWYVYILGGENPSVVLFSPDTALDYGATYTDIFDLSQSYISIPGEEDDETVNITGEVSFVRTMDRENGKINARVECLGEDGNHYVFTSSINLFSADDLHITIPAPTAGTTVSDWQDGIVISDENMFAMTAVIPEDGEQLESEDKFEAGKTYHLSFLLGGFGGEPFDFDPEGDYSGFVSLKDGTALPLVGDPFEGGFFTPMVSYTVADEEVVPPADDPDDVTPKTDEHTSPQTGDSFSMALCLSLMAASMAGVLYMKKKAD